MMLVRYEFKLLFTRVFELIDEITVQSSQILLVDQYTSIKAYKIELNNTTFFLTRGSLYVIINQAENVRIPNKNVIEFIYLWFQYRKIKRYLEIKNKQAKEQQAKREFTEKNNILRKSIKPLLDEEFTKKATSIINED